MSINALQQTELEEVSQRHEGFRVTDLSSASWCFRKLQALKASIADKKALADAEIDRIMQWQQKEVGALERDMQFFESLLIQYHQQQLDANPDAKTISTPYGKLKSRTVGPSIKKGDESKLLAHLKASGESSYIVTKESVSWAELKKKLQAGLVPASDTIIGYRVIDWNGEEVPGVEIELGGTTYTVEVEQ